jgi:hypothetical protein
MLAHAGAGATAALAAAQWPQESIRLHLGRRHAGPPFNQRGPWDDACVVSAHEIEAAHARPAAQWLSDRGR